MKKRKIPKTFSPEKFKNKMRSDPKFRDWVLKRMKLKKNNPELKKEMEKRKQMYLRGESIVDKKKHFDKLKTEIKPIVYKQKVKSYIRKRGTEFVRIEIGTDNTPQVTQQITSNKQVQE